MPPLHRIWSIVLIAFCLVLCWMGQATVFFNPTLAAKIGLVEPEEDVNPGLWADLLGESACDTLWLWTLGVAGILLWNNHPFWPYFGLPGAGMYVYFGTRGILQRAYVLKLGISYGAVKYIYFAMVLCGIWAVIGLVTIAVAMSALEKVRGRVGGYERVGDADA